MCCPFKYNILYKKKNISLFSTTSQIQSKKYHFHLFDTSQLASNVCVEETFVLNKSEGVTEFLRKLKRISSTSLDVFYFSTFTEVEILFGMKMIYWIISRQHPFTDIRRHL